MAEEWLWWVAAPFLAAFALAPILALEYVFDEE